MRIFLAGATGVLGRRLVPLLVAAGHDVIGTTTSEGKRAGLAEQGATPVVLDALDAAAVEQAVAAAEPDVVVHQMTALSGPFDLRHMDRTFALTNRLRTEGTDHLLAAARAAGVRRFVAQSFGGWPFARTGTAAKSEDDPLDPDPPSAMRPILDAIRYLEHAVTSTEGIEGVVLRYGGFYGPGTSIGLDPVGAQVKPVLRRQFPIVGNGAGVISFIHIDDAAAATALAIERARPGVYHVVDDEPAAVRDWLPALAAAVGAKPPRRVPTWLARLLAGEVGVVMMTQARGASNAKIKRELGWQPRFASWREGFVQGL
jgi:nucleoside-diphosphate-sugar epimerase